MPVLASEQTPVRELIARARAICDRQEPETWAWTDADLLRFLRAGIVELESLRPASGYVGLRRAPRAFAPVPERSDYESDAAWETAVGELLDEPVLVDGRWHPALVEHVCWEAFRRDESDASSQKLAAAHRQAFFEGAMK